MSIYKTINTSKITSFAALLIVLLFASCTDVIDVELQEGEVQLSVDAWINDKAETQVVRLRLSRPYFDTQSIDPVTGASVVITDNEGSAFVFTDVNNDGDYTWEPPNGQTFGEIGNSYTLAIETDGQRYTATSSMNRVVTIDSITQEFRDAELGDVEGIYAEFFARDFEGLDDCYWIKTFKNGRFLNKPQELNIAYDAGFSAGAEVDGLIFIPPIRDAINRIPDGADDAVDDSDVPPWAPGDSIFVEIHSIPVDAFTFLEQARRQMTIGDAGIFAEPLANVPTNIINEDANSTEKALGYFCVSAVSSLGRRIEEE
ncbi:MAG: DUF4249 domain-containing protein [Bacteroidota bacterium]